MNKILEDVFKQAQSKGSINYIYTLLRVTGITRRTDPLIQIEHIIEDLDKNKDNDAEFVKKYKSLLEMEDIFALIVNLVNCINEKPYDFSPFSSLNQGQFPNIVRPNLKQRIDFALKTCRESKQEKLEASFREVFPEKLIELIVREMDIVSEMQFLRDTYKKLKEFMDILIDLQHNARLDFLKQPKLYKLPRFEVLELLSLPDVGLCGFEMHFSNGTSARFERSVAGTDCINIILDRPIGFQVGLLDELKHEWRIREKRLYEIGLPGRYNKLGEWKPLVYPGNTDSLQKEASSLSKDQRVQGSYFYMMCTGYRVIEFVITTTLDLPIEHATIGDRFHLWKCPPLAEGNMQSNIRVYDCWVELDSTDVEYAKDVIDSIAILANRLAFTYGATVKWCIKYNMVCSVGGCATPNEEDLGILNNSLKNFPVNEDAMILDSAIDWFNHGRNSNNIFTRFLCYYITLESIVIAICDGDGDFRLEYAKEAKDKVQAERFKCIDDKYQKIYRDDPIRFIREAYFDCLESLNSKTRQVINLVFGKDHRYLQLLFEKQNDWSLNDIRGALAHGKLSHLDENNRELVAERIHEIENISRDLIYRLIFKLKSDEKIPSWSQQHTLSCSTADPRMTLVVSDEKIIPNKDWRIRPDWCD